MIIRPPIAPVLQGDIRYPATTWTAFFQAIADHIASLEAVIAALATVRANDAAAAAAGVAIGSPYWNGTAVVIRVV
jgi:hypothetical protein